MRIVRVVFTWAVVLALAWVAYKYVVPLFKPVKKETDIQTTEVRRGDLRLIVPSDGTVVPKVLVEVKSKASGVVEQLSVEPGDHVELGQVICELDKAEIEARLRQADADLSAAQAQLKLTARSLSPQQKAQAESSVRQARLARDDAQARYDRIKVLYDKGFATADELTTAKTALDKAEESLAQAEQQLELDLQGAQVEQVQVAQSSVVRNQAQVDQLKEELGYTTIRAPLTGTLLTRPVEVGTAVASGTSGMSGGTVVATIGDLSTMYVKAYIDETDLGKVSVGAPCRVTFDAFQGWLWKGKVRKIYPQGEASSQTGGNNGGSSRFQIDVELDLDSAAADKESGGLGGGSANRAGNRRNGTGSGLRGGQPPGGGPPGGGGTAAGVKSMTPGQLPPGAAAPGKAVKPPELRPQLSASVDIVLEDHPDVLMIPAQYVQYEGGKPLCNVLPNPEDKKKRERREVTLGFTDGLRFEIKTGLSEGETVVLERPIKQEAGRP